jgi:hypothetical protein
VFTLEPLSNELVPRLRFGELNGLQPKRIPAPSADRTPEDAISAGFTCSTPIVEELTTEEGTRLRYFCTHLGSQRRLGVLYLEWRDDGLDENDQQLMARFKAVRQALQDCLTIA